MFFISSVNLEFWPMKKDDNEVNMDLTGANTFPLKSRTKVFKNLISSFNVFTIWFTVFPSAAIVSPKPVWKLLGHSLS